MQNLFGPAMSTSSDGGAVYLGETPTLPPIDISPLSARPNLPKIQMDRICKLGGVGVPGQTVLRNGWAGMFADHAGEETDG